MLLARLLSLHVSVMQVHFTTGAEALAELLRDGDGSMAAACASDGDRQIRFAFPLVARERVFEELTQVREQLFRFRSLQNVAGDFRIKPCLGPQLVDKMRIGQVSKVKHQVRIDGQAILKTKTDDANDHVALCSAAGQVVEKRSLQIVHGESRRVDDARSLGTQRRKARALALNPAKEVARWGQWMRPARLAIATDEDVVRGVEEKDLDGVPSLTQSAHGNLGAFEERTVSDINTEAYFVDFALTRRQRNQLGRKGRRKIIDAVVPKVLKYMKRRRAPCSAHPGDNNDVHGGIIVKSDGAEYR